MAWTYIDTASQVWNHAAAQSNSAQIGNAQEMWNYFTNLGYSEEATAAIIGNAQHESALNPAQWQYGSYVGNPNSGYGLFQWDPARRYWQLYCGTYGYDRTDGYYQCQWVETQTIGGLDGNQWIGVVNPTSWANFKVSTDTPSNLAYAFCRNWERGNWVQERADNAEYWYTYFHGQPPTPPTPPTPPELPVWEMFLFLKRDRTHAIIKPRTNTGKKVIF